MKFYNLSQDSDFKALFDSIDPHPYAYNLKDKTKTLLIYIKNIKSPAANILKQDALSVGADALTSKQTILGSSTPSNALLIITKSQAKKLVPKLKLQDFGLKALADFLSQILLSSPRQTPQIMGIINLTQNSFNPSSMSTHKDIISKVEQFIAQGASIIDIGGASSKPNSTYIGDKREFENIKQSIDLIYEHKLYQQAKFSLDSFSLQCVQYALDRGFSIINDISANKALIPLAKQYDATYILMHASNEYLSGFFDKAYFDEYAAFDGDILDRVYRFFDAHLKQINHDKIILDIGIGFGKSMSENLLLIKHLKHFAPLNLPLLVGASRKGVINHYHPSDVGQRLAGTLFLHLQAIQNGASIIRVHDVFEHQQILSLLQAYTKADYDL